MSKTKFYIILIVALVFSNIIMAVILFLHKPFGPDTNRNIIIERLHFDENQTKKYDTLIQHHRLQWRKKESELLSAKNKLYEGLSNHDTLHLQSELDQIAHIVYDMERIHYSHFDSIWLLCNPSQQESFRALTKDLATMFSPRAKRK